MLLVKKKIEKYLCGVTHHRSQLSSGSSRRMSTCRRNTYCHTHTPNIYICKVYNL